MNNRITQLISIISITLFLMAPVLLFAQKEKNPGDQSGKADQKQLIKAMRIDSMPRTIFPPRQMLSEDQKKAEQFFVEASEKGKSGDYEGAIEDLTASLALSENGNSYFKRGYAYLLSGNFPMALQDFTEVLRIFPEYREAIFGRAIARFEMGDYKSAEEDMKQYLDLVNINDVAFDYMAALCFMRKAYLCALQNYSDVIRVDSLYPDVYTNRAMIRHYLRDYKGAMQDYDIAIKQNPEDKKIYNNRAATRMMMKDFRGALKDFDKAIELDPMYADAYNNRGRVKHHLDDVEGACSDWHKALSFGIETSSLDDNIAAITAKSIAGSSTVIPPVMFRKTSFAPKRKPALFSKTANNMFNRLALNPVVLR